MGQIPKQSCRKAINEAHACELGICMDVAPLKSPQCRVTGADLVNGRNTGLLNPKCSEGDGGGEDGGCPS